MIASSDRGVPALTRFGDEARASRCPPVRQPRRCCLGTMRGIVWGAKAKPPVFPHRPRRLCCKRADACCRARLTMTVLLPPVFFVIFIALVLAVFLEAARG